MQMAELFESGSPRWNWTTKLVVGLTFVAILAGLVLQFRAYVGPILLAFILAYLCYPIAGWLQRTLKISWRFAVTIFYIVIVLLLIGLLTLSGLAIVEQAQSLITLLNQALIALPQTLEQISNQVIRFGPFEFDLRSLDVQSLGNQILSAVQPLLGEVGKLLTTFATGAAGFVGWVAFILLISYFIISESGGAPGKILNIEIPGHAYDVRRLGAEFAHIWNTFLRGQLFLFFLSTLIYTVVLSILGLHYAFGLALLAGFGRFLPYVGPAIAWIAITLVAFFQGTTIFGLSPLAYAAVVLGISILIDTVFDNVVSPKFLGQTLRVHPAAVLVAALIAANLIGLVGVLLAAPVLASFKLLGRYTLRKMFDQDPWQGMDITQDTQMRSFFPRPVGDFLARGYTRVRQRILLIRRVRKPEAEITPPPHSK